MSLDASPSEQPETAAPLLDPDPVVVSVSPVKAREILRASRADVWALMGCNLVVFASSVCIMVLELAASRLIAAHLGQSLYSWTSVIGVVLAGISGGNFLGGWLADRYPPQRVLPWLFLAAGLLTLSVLIVNYWASGTEQAEWMSWPVWVMFVVAWIFFVPSVALGTISPVTASIALRRSQRTGVTVGNIYAWGAMGSIAGTFLAGFVLIDLFGTRAIIVMTAGMLLLMAVLVAVGQHALRSGVVFGGLPLVLLVGLFTAATAEKTAFAVTTLRTWAGLSDAPDPEKSLAEWGRWGKQLGRNLHDLGITLRLRQDNALEYVDESNYSEVSVTDYFDDDTGETYKALVLDALHHSYFDPEDPTRLHYDYEQIYAAITERAANRWARTTSVPLSHIPDPGFADLLPEGVRYDPVSKSLQVTGALGLSQLKELVDIGPDREYRVAVLQAFRDSRARQGEQSETPLSSLPAGVQFPVELAERVRYDSFFQQIKCDKPLSLAEAFQLLSLGEQKPYVEDLLSLFSNSRRVRTLFLGGGGYIFPRWIETYFPLQPSIDVAEIDPAVLKAVQLEMGLPSDPARTRVRSLIGDARKVVDDRLRENARRAKAGQAPVLYDFIYGDAFNHYSVPWHLTTVEFDTKVRGLLDPKEGLYLVNIIDIFPRAEFPPSTELAGRASAMCLGQPPESVIPPELRMNDQWLRAPAPFQKLQIRWKNVDVYELYADEPMSDEDRRALLRLTADESGETIDDLLPFREAVEQLSDATRERAAYSGKIPPVLTDGGLRLGAWVQAPAPFSKLEIRERDAGRYLLGYRGLMSEAERERLRTLAPTDSQWAQAVDGLHAECRKHRAGRFLARYVNTVREVFPFVYVFSSDHDGTSADRDTFVVACSLRQQDFSNLHAAGEFWHNLPFAWSEQNAEGQMQDFGWMPAVLDRALGQVLTDDFAPVDNLLTPLFDERD